MKDGVVLASTREGFSAINVLTFETVVTDALTTLRSNTIKPWLMTSEKMSNGDIWFGSNGAGDFSLQDAKRTFQSTPYLKK